MTSSFFQITGGGGAAGAGGSVIGLDLGSPNGGLADGISDYVVATGDVTVVYGSQGGFDPSVDLSAITGQTGFTIPAPNESAEFGYVLAAANDLIVNDTDALLIGARFAGTVSVVLAGDTDISFTVTGLPTAANDMSLAGLGDLNGDGFGDFAIGSPDAEFGEGAVYVIYGNADLGGSITEIDATLLDGNNGFVINGFGQNDLAGTSIAGGFDFDGDGTNDLLIGAPGTDTAEAGGDQAGAAYIIYGKTNTETPFAATEAITSANLDIDTFTGLAQFDALGTSVSVGASVNGDAIDDIIITAPEADGNASAAYVVFGGAAPNTDLATLGDPNADGFTITGVDGASAAMLGDVTGDGIGDIGVVATNGDVYIVYGQAGGFGDTVDVTTLSSGGGGLQLTGLFGAATPTSVTVTSLGDVNADTGGSISDIGIVATFADAPTASLTVLGGLANFAALDAADNVGGATDGVIDFAEVGEVDFVPNDNTVIFTGNGVVTVDEDTPNVTDEAIGITVSGVAGRFNTTVSSGLFGGFSVSANGLSWSYAVTDQVNLDDLNALGAGESVFDTATFVAANGSQREVTVIINGVDDIATVEIAFDTPNQTEDDGQITGSVTLNDPDTIDTPTLAGATGTGTFGNITVDQDGSFTYVITDASLQSRTVGDDAQEVITVTGDDGRSYDIVINIESVAEGIVRNFSDDANNPDTIFTSFGDDIINALAGDDFINAGAGNDTVDGGAGNDTIVDVLGDDDVTGGIGDDDILLISGDNIVDAGVGNDKIVTGFGFDTIDAGDGNDVIAADEGAIFTFGNNTITGGTGDDYMMGGAGADVFVFNDGDGQDTIGSFNPDNVTRSNDGFNVTSTGISFQIGVDKVDLSGVAGFTSGNIMDSMTELKGAAVFTNGADSITFVNVLLATNTDDPDAIPNGLSASDFLFA